jgi:hypothetical protein
MLHINSKYGQLNGYQPQVCIISKAGQKHINTYTNTVYLVISKPKYCMYTVYIYIYIYIYIWFWTILIISRAGHNRAFTPHMAVYVVISLPELCICTVYISSGHPDY